MNTNYKPFTPKAAVELASPPSLVAAVMPVFVGGATAFGFMRFTPFVFDVRATAALLLMFVTAVLMQAAVNTLNDYQDFLSGTDTAETILDTHDASIVYNQINPRSALRFGIVLLVCAALSGCVLVLLSHWALLIVGVAAAAVVVLYSAGPKPVSFLPIGEFVSGLVMGVCITASTYYALTLRFNPLILLVAMPPFLTIALIMLTNNTCDIERDIEARRQTLPALIGRENAMKLAAALAWAVPASMFVLSLPFWYGGIFLTLLLVLLMGSKLKRISTGPYARETRGRMMGNIVQYCLWVNLSWTLCIFSGCFLGGLLP